MRPRANQKRANSNQETDGPLSWEQLRDRIAGCGAEGNTEALRDLSIKIVRQCQSYRERAEKLSELHEVLRAKCEALSAPEHYAVVITAVSNNGSRSVEVTGPSSGRVHVMVHPDVPDGALRIGATGLVTRERNCLIRVLSDGARWTNVATFEDYLEPEGRVLLKDRDNFVVVGLADQLKTTTLRKGDLVGFDPHTSQLAFEKVRPPNHNQLFDETIESDFSELVGLEGPLSLIRNVINFRLLHPQLSARYRLPQRYGLLLYGPAGNGKTHIARCVAGYLRQLFPGQPCRFMHVSGSQDYSMWLGQSEQQLMARFEAAREAARDGTVVIFFDEIDAIGRRRGTDFSSGAADRILNTFLTLLDGVVQNANIIVIAATNRADTLDEGLTRPGRFDCKISIPAPGRRTSAAILEHYLQDRPLAGADHNGDPRPQLVPSLLVPLFAPNGHLAEVATVKLSDGRQLPVAGRALLSGAMLKNVVDVAAQQAALRESETGVPGIREDDLVSALENELRGTVGLLTAANVKAYVSAIPRDAQPLDVQAKLPEVSATAYVRPVL